MVTWGKRRTRSRNVSVIWKKNERPSSSVKPTNAARLKEGCDARAAVNARSREIEQHDRLLSSTVEIAVRFACDGGSAHDTAVRNGGVTAATLLCG